MRFKPMKLLLLALVCLGTFLVPGRTAEGQVPIFDKNSAFEYLKRQCAFGPRSPGSKGHADCMAFLEAEFRRTAAQTVLQAFTARDFLSNRIVRMGNVIASFGRQGERLLFCAHWDSRSAADNDPDPGNRDKPVPGANDGASGTAVLLELSRILKRYPPPRGVDLVLFDGEDGGLEMNLETWCLGSRYFAAHRRNDYKPRYAVLLDMIGDRDLSLPVEANSRKFAPAVVETVWGKARELGLPAFESRIGYEVVDDHLELLKSGIPAVDIIDLDYPYWHTTHDTEDKCSPESLWTVGTLLLHLIYE
jgi:glutaminyl-peptide cyclotransferase